MSIFDGMTGVLNEVFGAPVTIYPGGGAAVSVRGVLRRQQVTLATNEGPDILDAVPVLRVPRPGASGLIEGDCVETGGETFEVRFKIPSESPAEDRFEAFALWEVEA